MKGRKPKPDNVHYLNGNPSKKNLAALSSGVRIPVEIPACPTHLKPQAKKEWKRISVELFKLGLISNIDMAALAVYCQAYARWITAEKKLKEGGDDAMIGVTPSGYQQMSVWLQISNRAVEQMKSFLTEFGMTPSSRARVDVSPQQDLFGDDDSDSEKDPNAKYFSD